MRALKFTDESTDVTELPRFAQSFNYTEEVDGEYFYRVSIVDEEDVVLSRFFSEEGAKFFGVR